MPGISDLRMWMANTGTHRFAVREVFFRGRTGQLGYIALHTDGLFDHEDILVPVSRFSPFDEGDLCLYLSDEEIRAAPGWAEGAEPDPRVDRLERVSHRIGAEVFGGDGPIGTLDDMRVSRVGYAITDLIISGRKVPYGRLRHMSEEGAHIVVNLDAAELAALPGA
ncbi:MAG: hypothetical protein ACK5JR_13335 [Tropicimonas sp.]|uniref:hypothetical protein n=1 Tax=Tropicimonas sp. TaxID=2067044 RepID=UPI003A860F97